MLIRRLGKRSVQMEIFGEPLPDAKVGAVAGLIDEEQPGRKIPRCTVNRIKKKPALSHRPKRDPPGRTPKFEWCRQHIIRTVTRLEASPTTQFEVTSAYLRGTCIALKRKREESGRGATGDIPSCRTIRRMLREAGFHSVTTSYNLKELTKKDKILRRRFCRKALRPGFKVDLHCDEKDWKLRKNQAERILLDRSKIRGHWRKMKKGKNGKLCSVKPVIKNNVKATKHSLSSRQCLGGLQSRGWLAGGGNSPVSLFALQKGNKNNTKNFVREIGKWARKFREANPSRNRTLLKVLCDQARFHGKTAKKQLRVRKSKK